MGNINKLPLRIPGVHISPKQKPLMSQRFRTDLTFAVGSVLHVDVEKQVISVILKGDRGPAQDITITQPFAGTSSYIMGMPEEGCTVVLAYQDGMYYPIAYLPHYELGIEAKNVHKWPDGVKTNSQNNFFYRVRKLQEGEIALSSKFGVELYLSDYLLLEDKNGNSIVLKPEHDSIISTSCNNYVFSSGLWLSSGIIRRNSIDASDLNDMPNVYRDPNPKGDASYSLRPGGSNDTADPYYTEYLLEVEDRSYGQQPLNDVNAKSNLTVRKPIIIQSLGNLVGNTPHNDFYGRMLRVVLFSGAEDDRGDFSFQQITGSENDTLGLAYSLFKPHRANSEYGAFFGIDKEGHFYQFIPSTSGGGIGGGRSMSTVARGSLKEIWGKDSNKGNSWDLTTTGGVKWKLGQHNERDGNDQANRSLDIRADGGSLLLLGSQLSADLQDFTDKSKTLDDVRGYKKIEKVGGKERSEVTSARETIIGGSDKIQVGGAKIEQVLGQMDLSVGTSLSVKATDNYSEVAKGVKDENYGSRSTVVGKGSVELKINSPLGDIKEEIRFKGSRVLRLSMGDVTETILTRGNRKTTIASGNYQVSILTQGNFNFNTNVGQINLKSNAGQVTIKSTTGIKISTLPASNINISGGSINLKGKTQLMGGVVTTKTHLDYTTGAPLKGSTSVKASF